MTVSDKEPLSGAFIADGVNRSWDFHFKISEISHAQVVTRNPDGTGEVIHSSNIAINTQYINTDNGGKLIFPSNGLPPIAAGTLVFTRRKVPLSQPARIGNQGRFYPETHEDAFDRAAMQIQEIAVNADRSLKIPTGESASDIPTALNRAGKILSFDSEGNPEVKVTKVDVSIVAGISDQVAIVAGIRNEVVAVSANSLNINKVAAIDADVKKVAAVDTDVVKVSTISADVVKVSGIVESVTRVSAIAEYVVTVAGDRVEIIAVANNKTNIDAVAGNKTNIDAVAGNKTNIDTVAASKINIDKVAANETDITKVSTNMPAVLNVSGNMQKVDIVASIAPEIVEVADIRPAVLVVASISADVEAVADNRTNINTVAASKTNIDAVAGNKANIDTVAANITPVISVSTNITNVVAVSDNKANIDAVAANATNINAVKDNTTNINAVAGNKTNIDAVAGAAVDIAAVSTNIAAVKNASENMTAIIAAPTKAEEAAQSATDAAESKRLAELVTSAMKGGTSGQILVKLSNNDYEYVWQNPTSGGDMFKVNYDPRGFVGDVFDMDYMTEGDNNKILSPTERSAISANSTARHSHSNKSTLDNITAAFTSEEKTLLASVSPNANPTNITTVGAALAAPTPSTSLVDGDKIAGVGSGGAVLKTWSWETIKAGIKALTDTLYATVAQGIKADGAVRFDVAQSLDGVKQSQARDNLFVPSRTDTTMIYETLDAAKLDKTGTAADSAKLGNETAAQWQSKIVAKAGFYTGSNVNETNYPVGQYLAMWIPNPSIARWSTVAVFTGTSNFFFGSGGSQLSGSWRVACKIWDSDGGNRAYLIVRVA